ncbi:hypothetical protein DdX_16900 [Ditylenchus destructor]|uniref:Uncharacterized protein n=1 Tax=Ditylenchus destructor TaxID=166010 RepID=A0AAD4MNS6_9BILA|nr:hypothetical protein DdX_16900 [Ditylenchus destructor]
MKLYTVLLVSFLIAAKCDEYKRPAMPAGKFTPAMNYKEASPKCGKDCPGIWKVQESGKEPQRKKLTKEQCEEERELLKCLKNDPNCEKIQTSAQKKYIKSHDFIKVCKGLRVSAIDLAVLSLLIFLSVLVANVL